MDEVQSMIEDDLELATTIASLSRTYRESLYSGLDHVRATCRSGRDSISVLATVYAAEANSESRPQVQAARALLATKFRSWVRRFPRCRELQAQVDRAKA